MLLASIGLYGAMAHVVASRTREIGTRMAVGADRSQIMRMVFQRSLGVAALGIFIGLPLSFAGSKAIASLLFGVAPGDPVTFASAAGLLAAVSLLAAWHASRAALRIVISTEIRELQLEITRRASKNRAYLRSRSSSDQNRDGNPRGPRGYPDHPRPVGRRTNRELAALLRLPGSAPPEAIHISEKSSMVRDFGR